MAIGELIPVPLRMTQWRSCKVLGQHPMTSSHTRRSARAARQVARQSPEGVGTHTMEESAEGCRGCRRCAARPLAHQWSRE